MNRHAESHFANSFLVDGSLPYIAISDIVS